MAKEQKKSTNEDNNGIPMVDEYKDVFPKEVLGLPPSRKVDFAIDLVSGVGPISVASYHIAPTKLAKLTKQIEELLEKKFIKPSLSVEVGVLVEGSSFSWPCDFCSTNLN